jgi:hypothetical protein
MNPLYCNDLFYVMIDFLHVNDIVKCKLISKRHYNLINKGYLYHVIKMIRPKILLNESYDMICDTMVSKKYIKKNIVKVYTEIYTIIKLPIVLNLLFQQETSMFYQLPYELKNVILSFTY